MMLRAAALLSCFLASPFARADKASLDRASARLRMLGTPAATADRAARHIELGMPSPATRKNDNDLLLVRNSYVISYNAKRNAMNWASWEVSNQDLGDIGRHEKFRPDATLPKRFYQPNSGDYKMPGFSRGHMVRSGERTRNPRENAKTFVFTNMLPQAVNNNTGPWNEFEDFYRAQVTSGELVAHVMAGGVFGQAPVEQRNVAVPSATWKVVALLKKGQRVEDIDDKTRVISIIIPNNNEDVKVDHDWGRYRTSVSDIEKKTGLKFFDSMTPRLAQAMKDRVDESAVPPPEKHDWVRHNYGENGQAKLKQMLHEQVTGVVKWYDGDRKFGFITMPDGKDVFVSGANRVTSIKAGEKVTLDVGLNTDDKMFAMKVVSHAADAVPAQLEKAVKFVPKIVGQQVTGKVAFFDETKKFGFITLADGSDVYVNAKHRITTLAKGDNVTLDVAEGADTRNFAMKVRSLSPAATLVLQPAVR